MIVNAPQARIAIGFAMVGGQKVPITIDIEWMRFFSELTAQSNSYQLSALVGAQGIVGASLMMDGGEGGDVEFVPGLKGERGERGEQGPAVGMLEDSPGGDEQIFLLSSAAAAVAPGGASWTEVDIDFGTKPVFDATFTITDAAITSSAVKVALMPSGKAATGRTADDWQWDGGTFVANPGTGSATCYATFSPGPIVGRRKLQYQIG